MAKREKRNRSRGSAGTNRKMGEDFLEKNRRKEGVVETGPAIRFRHIPYLFSMFG